MKAIIGLGNPIRADDGIGIRLIKEIRKKDLPPDVEVFDSGNRVMRLLHLLNDLEIAVIVDAVHFGGNPGDFVFFSPEEVKSLNTSKNTHDTNILEVLELSKTLNKESKEIIIMGIEPKDTSFEEGISQELKDRLPEMIDELLKKIMVMGSDGK